MAEKIVTQNSGPTEELKKKIAEARIAAASAKTAAEAKEMEERITKAVLAASQKLQGVTTRQSDNFETISPGSNEDIAKRAPGYTSLIRQKHEWRTDYKLKDLQDWNDTCVIAAKAMNRPVTSLALYQNQSEKMSELAKAMNATTAAEGQSWVPTELSAQVIEMIALKQSVAGVFRRIVMPTSPFDVPRKTGRSTLYFVNESTTDNPATFRASTPAVGKLTLSAKKFANRVNLSDEITEDSVVAMLDIVRDDIADVHARGVDDSLINGDVSATHQDTDTTEPDSIRKTFSGIRKLTNSGAQFDVDMDGGGTLGFADFQDQRALMGIYGVSPSDLVWITSINGYFKIINALVDQVVTLDKYGPNAVIFNGELGQMMGIPIIVSEHVRTDLAATGLYDGTTTTKTVIILARRDGGVIGQRRALTIETDRLIGSDQQVLVATQRLDFQQRFASAEKCFGFMKDITS